MAAYQIFQLPKTTPLDSIGVTRPGAKAYFYATGTTTPQDTYSDSGLTTPNANPVVADQFGVLGAIYLDPTKVYKLTLNTSADTLIYTIDPVNEQILSQAVIGQYLYPQTTAEQSAGVTPVNYSYAPGDVRRYGADLDGTDDALALTNAIAQCVETDGAPVYIPGTLSINSSVILLSGTSIYGDGTDKSSIYGLANTFSLLIDNNSPVTDITIEDLLFDAVSAGTSTRGIFLDADTSNISERIKIRRCKFQNLFRGINIHRGDDIEISTVEGTALGSSIAYIGVSTAAGRSSNVRISDVVGYDIDTTPDAAGSGIICVHYADDVTVIKGNFNNTGKSGDTHHHSIYLRDLTGVVCRDIVSTGQLGGAVVHVFADVGSGENRNEGITISGIQGYNLPDYAALRLAACDNMTLNDVVATGGKTQALYISDINHSSISNIIGKNNNRQKLSGTNNAMVWAEDLTSVNFTNIVGNDDIAGTNEYGQSTLFAFHGDSEDIHMSNCRNSWGGTAGFGYYGIEIVSGATLTRFSVSGFIQIAASNAFHETGSAFEGTFTNISLTGTGSSTPFSTTQLHKFSVSNVFVAGVPWVYESASGYIMARLSAAPTSGTWKAGDEIRKLTFTATTSPGWGCITSGTFSSATDNTGDTDGSMAVITGMADTSDFFVGEYVTVSAGFASTGPFQITAKTSSTITVNANSNSAQSNVTVSTPDPTFGAMAALT